VLRGVGLAVGLFALANLTGELARPPFDTTSTWITGAGLPHVLLVVLELAGALALIAHGVRRIQQPALRVAGAIVVGAGALLSVIDAARFYAVLERGAIHSPAIVPASAFVAACLGTLATTLLLDRDERPPWTWRRALACAGIAGAVFALMPLLLMVTFGPTRYARRADCAIVFGARVWDDGTPSHALADRVDESIALYQQGLVQKLVMSGAIDAANGWSEPKVMRARAVGAGVPAEDVILDEAGVDTASTVRNGAALMRSLGLGSALAVTHYYHEPRVKMLFDRAGVQVYTVPARMKWRLLKEPIFVAREVLAYWHSFLLQ
jgi:uncharacterized SAM-binding protein YcdF (DUF218 family)